MESGQFQALGNIGRGLMRVSFAGFGETSLEAMNKCFRKMREFMSTDQRDDDMDDDSWKYEADTSNLQHGFNPDTF